MDARTQFARPRRCVMCSRRGRAGLCTQVSRHQGVAVRYLVAEIGEPGLSRDGIFFLVWRWSFDTA
jgi:hypothetical protein